MPVARPLRVVFLGTPAFAVPSLEGVVASGAELVAVVCQPDRPKGRGLELQAPPTKVWAESRGIPVHQPEKVRNGKLRALLEPYAPDLLVVTAYGRILPKEVLELPPLGALNGHASVLPKYRGAAPIQWAVASGETVTGVTVMQMDEGLDTGAVLLRQATPIRAEETTADLHDRLSTMGADLILQALDHLPDLALQPQSAEGVTYAAKIDKAEAQIDWTLPAEQVDRQIRGLSPFPGAWTMVADERLKLLRSRLAQGAGAAGQVLHGMTIACGSGAVEITEAQREGKRPASATDLLRGFALPALLS